MFQSQSTNYLKLVCFIATALCLARFSMAQNEVSQPLVTVHVTGICGDNGMPLYATGEGSTVPEACAKGQKKILAENPGCKRPILDECPEAAFAPCVCPTPMWRIIYYCSQPDGRIIGFKVSAPTLAEAKCKGRAKVQELCLTCCSTSFKILEKPCQPQKKRLFPLFK